MDNTLVLDEIRKLVPIDMCSARTSLVDKLYQNNAKPLQPCLLKTGDSSKKWKPLVIIIPLRLGLHGVNAEYIEQLQVDRSHF